MLVLLGLPWMRDAYWGASAAFCFCCMRDIGSALFVAAERHMHSVEW